jgi:hypothetical protein
VNAVAELADVDPAELRACIEDQRCPWCDRSDLRSLSSHTVRAHGVYAHELRELAGLAPAVPLCAPSLSDCHRQLARDQDTSRWLQRPEVVAAAAAARESNYDEEQRRRRVAHLDAVRDEAIEALRRSVQAEREDPELASARRLARSERRRKFRKGAECPICGAWFCTVVPVGHDYRQRKYCGDECRSEGTRRLRKRTWVRDNLARIADPDGAFASP